MPFNKLSAILMSLAFALPLGAENEKAQRKQVPVDPSYFIKSGLAGEIKKEMRALSDGSKVLCYVIPTKNQPQEHKKGPWSPKKVTDGKDKGGIWFKDGKVYDVDGPFVANLAKFYNDPEWNLVNEDGTIKVTDTKEAFEAAARPDVDPKYKNHSVEGNPAWYPEISTTFIIPVNPVYQEKVTTFKHGSVGLAFNGVGYDPPAPVHMIIKAYTIAPLDDGGGHMNPFAGYHYHAATGKTKEIKQDDGHASMIGYAMDGFGIFAHLDEDGKPATELDECGGHYDDVRGYHYHVGAAGDNQIIKAFRGIAGEVLVEGAAKSNRRNKSPRGGRSEHTPHQHPHE